MPSSDAEPSTGPLSPEGPNSQKLTWSDKSVLTARTKTELKAKLDARGRELEETSTSAPHAGTVAAAVADWQAHLPRQIKDPTTVALVRRHGERITAELGRIPLRRLQARDVERLLQKMAAEGLSTSTIRGCRSVLARSLDRAIRDRLITVNVARMAEVPEGTRRQSRSMTTAQARQLLDSDLSVWWRAYFTLALYCGLRPGELTGLRWEDADTDAGLIRVRRSLKRGADGLAPR